MAAEFSRLTEMEELRRNDQIAEVSKVAWPAKRPAGWLP